MSRKPTIALVGLSGAGKSTVAALVGERLGSAPADLDALIEADAGCSIAQIFAREGAAGFRGREADRLAFVLRDPPAVLACGGGVVLDPEQRARLVASCRVVWLEVSPAEAARRVAGSRATRPLLAEGLPKIETMLEERGALYGEVAELRVPTDGRTPEQVAEAVLSGLGLHGGKGTR